MSHYEKQYRGTYNLVKEEQALVNIKLRDHFAGLAMQGIPEQEPVAWMYEEATSFDGDGYLSGWATCFYLEKADEDKSLRNETPLYTAPPKREPLSDEEIAILWGDKYSGKTFMVRNFARAIEKAHGITGGEE